MEVDEEKESNFTDGELGEININTVDTGAALPITVVVSINNCQVRMMVDTGAAVSVITEKKACLILDLVIDTV